MDCFEIEGGIPLHGEVTMSGAKNAALPLMAAALMARGKTTLTRVPDVKDIRTMMQILRGLGAEVEWRDPNTVEIEVRDESATTVPHELVKTMRASISLLGPLLARRGRATVAQPGGCVIGARPIDLHLKGVRALGATVEEKHGNVTAEALRLFGDEVYLGGPNGSTVLGTANILSAATLAEGTTVIEDAACEPEITELAKFLNRMGARVRNIGAKRLTIEGVEELRGAEFEIPPDRIESGTFMVAAAVTGGNVLVRGARREHLGAVLDVMNNAGFTMIPEADGIRVIGGQGFLHLDLTTGPFPAFPTDLQAQMMVPLCLADGISVVTERIYPDRFMHIMELNRLGAKIRKEGAIAIIMGRGVFSGAPVTASDLRASAALVVAGLVATGKTRVSRVYHIDRGYEKIEQKLESLGARIRRMPDPDSTGTSAE